MRRFLLRLANLFGSRRAEREMTREMESHLSLLQEDFERRGMLPAEARLSARRAYGGVEFTKELHREARSFVWVEQFVKDVRYAARNLWGNPGFTAVAVIALAIGLGVNATLFSLYNTVVLKPLPVADPGRLVRVKRWLAHGSRDSIQYNFAYPEYRYLLAHSTVFSGLTADSGEISALASVSRTSAPEHLTGHLVSGNYFGALRVNAALGRTFGPEEDREPGASPVVVLSDRFWRRSYNGDPRVIGRTIQLDGLTYNIIGVAPRKFTGTDRFPFATDFWAPLSMFEQLAPAAGTTDDSWREQWRDATPPWFELLGRVRNGVSIAKAQAETDLLARQFLSRYREKDRTTAVTVVKATNIGEGFFDGYSTAGLMLGFMTGLVLLVACANVANMLLARGAARQSEIGLRMALGAGRGRILRQAMIESLMLSVLGAAGGLLLSTWASRLLWLAISRSFQGFRTSFIDPDLSPDFRVMAFGLALALATALLFGLAPAVRLTRVSLNAVIKREASLFGARVSQSRLRSVLLGTQVTAAVMLLSASGDLASTLFIRQNTDLGFDARNTFLMMRDNERGKAKANDQRLRERLAALPELASVAVGDAPLLGNGFTGPMAVGKMNRPALASYASDAYFEALGIRLLRGRSFTQQEADRAAPLAVISEATAKHFWPNENPLGKRFSLDLASDNHFTDFEVIGIAKDIHSTDIAEIDATHIYLPTGGPQGKYQGGVLFRIHGDRTKALAAVRSAVESVDRALLPGLNLISLEEGPVAMVREAVQGLALAGEILVALSLTLAAVGIYGVMAYLVTQRTREIGIRVALGATARALIGGLLAQCMRPVFLGIAAGTVLGFVFTIWEESQAPFPDSMVHSLFGDPNLYAELVLMVAVAILACVAPAKRALRVDPAITLRHE
ncbi:MAG: ABC transporter permease [Acidobacteriia bacterium]|nr:ABC transporter permease [Terriglobia bacterium]